jgi:hypothetical protein
VVDTEDQLEFQKAPQVILELFELDINAAG